MSSTETQHVEIDVSSFSASHYHLLPLHIIHIARDYPLGQHHKPSNAFPCQERHPRRVDPHFISNPFCVEGLGHHLAALLPVNYNHAGSRDMKIDQPEQGIDEGLYSVSSTYLVTMP